MTQRLYLGIDGGASNITVVMLNDQAEVLFSQTLPGGANYHALGLESVITHLQEAVLAGVHRLTVTPPVVFERAVFGLAGCNFESDRKILVEALRRSSLSSQLGGGFEVVNDSRIALRAGTDDGVGIGFRANGTGERGPHHCR